MIYKTLIGVLIVAALTSGCAVRADRVKLKVPGVEVGLESGGGGGGYHCPPGQAKKGRC